MTPLSTGGPASLLPLLVAVPLAVAGLLVALRLPPRVRIASLLAVVGAQFVSGVALLAVAGGGTVLSTRVGGWSPLVAIPFTVDALAAMMVTMMTLVALVVIPFAIRVGAASEPFFAPLVLLLMAGVVGAVLTGDLFNLFVFIEVMLLPSYALMILARRGQGKRMQVTATRIYITVNLTTSSIMLIGIAILHASLGGVGFTWLLGRGADTPAAALGSALVLLALCVKAAVVPGHGWLGRTYPHMSPTMSALFSGLHTKVAVYAVFRMHSVLFGGGAQWTTLGLVLFATSMVVGALAAIGETDARAVLSLHMVSQIGYVLLGLAVHTPAALAAAVFYLVHNVISKASLFLSTGAVETAYGRHGLGEVSGLLRRERLTALAFFPASMSLAGLPPMSGFLAKLALIVAAFAAGQWAAGVVALVASLLTLMSMLKLWGAMFLGEPAPDQGEDDGPRIGWSLIWPALVLTVLSGLLGICGAFFYPVAQTAAHQLLDPSLVVGAVTR